MGLIPYKKCIEVGHTGGWSKWDGYLAIRNDAWELTSDRYSKQEIDGRLTLIRLPFLEMNFVDRSTVVRIFDTNELMMDNLNKLKEQNPNLIWIQSN